MLAGTINLLFFFFLNAQTSIEYAYLGMALNLTSYLLLLQDVYPIRNKAVNYYKTPSVFNAVFEIFKLFMTDKLKSRVSCFFCVVCIDMSLRSTWKV